MKTITVFVGSCDPDCDGWSTSVWRVDIRRISGLEPTSDAALRYALERIPCSAPPADEAFTLEPLEVERLRTLHRPLHGFHGETARWHDWSGSTDDGLPIAHFSVWGTPR